MKKITGYFMLGGVTVAMMLAAVFALNSMDTRKGRVFAAVTAAPATGSPAPSAAATVKPSASAVPAASTAPTPEPPISVMDAPVEQKITRKGLIYEYTGLEAHLIGCTDAVKQKTTLTIPGKIAVKDIYYDVTMIDYGALKGCTKLKKVSVGRYMKQIRYSAFQGDTKLCQVVFQGKKLNNVGNNAFKNTAKRITFKMPAARVKKYKKLLKNGNPSSKAVYKKKS